MSTPTVVVLHAHPDDEAIFTGATAYRLARAGVRVVLVTATAGEAGQPRIPLRPGETLAERRVQELERACELLGIQRLVLLGHRDSGAHRGPYPGGTLGAATPDDVARRVAAVVEQEDAAALVHYDRGGIYQHVDHVRVHQAGALAARLTGVTGYEATVDGERLQAARGPGGARHVLHAAAEAVGRDPDRLAFPAAALVSVNDDEEAAREATRRAVCGLFHPVPHPYYDSQLRQLGFADFADTACELMPQGRTREAMAAVPDEVIAAMTITGPPARCARRLAEYEGAADEVIAFRVAQPGEPAGMAAYEPLLALAAEVAAGA